MWAVIVGQLVHASTGGCGAAIDEFRHIVRISTANTARVDESFRFRAPAATCESIELPRRMDGFTLVDAELAVRDGRLPRRTQWREGDIVRIERTRELGRGPHSFEVKRPEFPVGLMSVELQAPSWVRLNVWADPQAQVNVDAGRMTTYTASFSGGGRLVWSSEKDWWAVGERFGQTFDARVINRWALGDLAADVERVTIAEALKRMAGAVALDPVGTTWQRMRPLPEVLRDGRGSAAERAALLISLLRAAGHDAQPVMVRPVAEAEVPLIVPGDALFSRVAVKVNRGDAPPVWLDPASPYSLPDAVPLELRGVVVLEPGDQPRAIFDHMKPDGRVIVRGRGTLGDDGALELMVEVTAEDGGTQAVRDLLGPLPKGTRQQWLGDLLRVARPDLDGLRVQVFGVEDPRYPFGMSVELAERSRFRALGSGRIGRLPAVLAPQLARVLPPNIEVVEEIELQLPGALRPYALRPVEDPADPEAIVTRMDRIDGDTVRLRTRALRPWRKSDRVARTVALLDEASQRGPELIAFGSLDRAAARALQRDATVNTDTRVLEALLWYQSGDGSEGDKVLRRVVRSGRVRDVADALARLAGSPSGRPWDVVWESVVGDHERVLLVEALEARGAFREAWRRGSMLLASEDPAVQVSALVLVARVQGERPPANVDEAAHRAWREPAALLARAERLAEELWPGRGSVDIDVALAERLLERGLCAEAGPKIQRAMRDTSLPRARAVYAEWRACSDKAPATSLLQELILSSGFDGTVIRAAVRIWAERGEARMARRWAMLAAHVARTDPQLWREAIEASLLAGDLTTAVYAARQASDVEPRSMAAGVPLNILATLAGDAENAAIGERRADYRVSVEPFPIPLEHADRFMEEHQRLPFLKHRDRDVRDDPVRLDERHARHLEAGDPLHAARDAALRVKLHADPEGAYDAYLATAPLLWATHSTEPLRPFLRDPKVRQLHMETALLTGSSDPMTDASALRDDPLADNLRLARWRSRDFAERVRWSYDGAEPKLRTPSGFAPSRLLSALPGVSGFSNRPAGSSLVVTAVPERLPPPVEGFFRLGDRVGATGEIELFALEGGHAPAFAARRVYDGLTWWGLARNHQLALAAVEAGIAAQAVFD